MFRKLKKDIDKELRSFLEDSSRGLDLKRTSPELYRGIKDFVLRDGKRIRPILFLIGYLGYSRRKNVSRKKLIRSSLSIELLHDFLLVHDDVIDNSDLRRGKPTLHRLFNTMMGRKAKDELGPSLSIVAGDVIFAMAIEALLACDETASRKEKALAELIKATSSTGIGEFLDVINNIKKINKVSRKEVFLTYTLKTAKYTFECPLVMGALLAGAPSKEISALSALGISLGQAFQIQDDLLDIFSSSKKIGKPVLSDLNESKKTLLLWRTYNKLPQKEKRELKRLLDKKKKSYADLLKFRKMIKTVGAGEYCIEIADYLLSDASSTLESLRMNKKYKTSLKNVMELWFDKTREIKTSI